TGVQTCALPICVYAFFVYTMSMCISSDIIFTLYLSHNSIIWLNSYFVQTLPVGLCGLHNNNIFVLFKANKLSKSSISIEYSLFSYFSSFINNCLSVLFISLKNAS